MLILVVLVVVGSLVGGIWWHQLARELRDVARHEHTLKRLEAAAANFRRGRPTTPLPVTPASHFRVLPPSVRPLSPRQKAQRRATTRARRAAVRRAAG